MGTQVGAMPALFTQGSISPTGVPTDVAIEGNGFFAVQNSSGVVSYTRAGDFETNQQNYLVTTDGQQVLVYPAVNGVVQNGGGVAPLQLGAGSISPPSTTANVQITTNLDASMPVGTEFSTPVTIYDSLGAPHNLTFNFTNEGPNTWTYSVNLPPTDLNAVNGVPQTGQLATGTLTFNGNGQLIGTGGGAGTPTYGATNVGNGTVSGLATTATTVAQTVTLTATSPTTFSVAGSVSGNLGTATVGVPFTSPRLDFTLNQGSTSFATGDTVTIPTTTQTLNNITGIPHQRIRRRRNQPDF
jgi:flagellar hook protein FlgE